MIRQKTDLIHQLEALVPQKTLQQWADAPLDQLTKIINEHRQKLADLKQTERRSAAMLQNKTIDDISQKLQGDVIGVAGYLAYVEDLKESRLLASSLGSRLGTILLKDRKAFDTCRQQFSNAPNKVEIVSQDTLNPFKAKDPADRPSDRLPIQYPFPPDNFPGFVDYSVNRLQFRYII